MGTKPILSKTNKISSKCEFPVNSASYDMKFSTEIGSDHTKKMASARFRENVTTWGVWGIHGFSVFLIRFQRALVPNIFGISRGYQNFSGVQLFILSSCTFRTIFQVETRKIDRTFAKKSITPKLTYVQADFI